MPRDGLGAATRRLLGRSHLRVRRGNRRLEVAKRRDLPYDERGEPMREPEVIEAELMEIAAIADDTLKLERIVAWCAVHPDEIPFALHQMMGQDGRIAHGRSWRD